MNPRLKLPVIQELPSRLFISRNDKTGYSLNVPIAETCKPTEACSRYCYGNNGPISWDKALGKQYENHRRLEYLRGAPKRELELEADLAYHHVYPMNFFRLYGVGDLTEGGVRFINVLAKRHPDLTLWVATRKIELARKLVFADNLHIMASLDATTKGEDVHATYAFLQARNGHGLAAWVQQSADEKIPSWVKVVFPEHMRERRAPWTADKKTRDPRSCPATVVGGVPHKNACENCRFCFSTERRAAGRP